MGDVTEEISQRRFADENNKYKIMGNLPPYPSKSHYNMKFPPYATYGNGTRQIRHEFYDDHHRPTEKDKGSYYNATDEILRFRSRRQKHE